MLKGAIFDLGGTLIHLTVSWDKVREWRVEAILEQLRSQGVTLDRNYVKQEYLRLHDEESEYSDRTLEEIDAATTFTRLLDRLKIKEAQRPPMADLVERSFELEVDSWVLFPGVEAMLQQVRGMGLKVGVLSNAMSDWAIKEILQRRGLTRYLDSVLTSAAMGIRKPRPEPFHEILRLLNLQGCEAVMVGDSKEADVAGAKPLGIRAIQVVFDKRDDDDEPDPDISVSTISDIVPAIKQIASTC